MQVQRRESGDWLMGGARRRTRRRTQSAVGTLKFREPARGIPRIEPLSRHSRNGRPVRWSAQTFRAPRLGDGLTQGEDVGVTAWSRHGVCPSLE